MRSGCAVCCMLDGARTEEWRKHKVLQCTAHPGTTGLEVDHFRRMIQDSGGIHSCRRCWVSQKFCATGQDGRNPCQWPNVVVPLARAVAGTEMGRKIIQGCGFTGDLGGNWVAYAVWLGKRHRERVWGEFFSNAMVIAIRIIIFIQERRLGR